jgi:hypothetical protein
MMSLSASKSKKQKKMERNQSIDLIIKYHPNLGAYCQISNLVR